MYRRPDTTKAAAEEARLRFALFEASPYVCVATTRETMLTALARSCRSCRRPALEHPGNKCLFDHTDYAPLGEDEARALLDLYCSPYSE